MNNWFGITNPLAKMSIVAVIIFFPVMINTVRGLTLVDAGALELLRSYAAGDFTVLTQLRLPNALPFMFSAFKVAGTLSVIGAIVSEYFGGSRQALTWLGDLFAVVMHPQIVGLLPQLFRQTEGFVNGIPVR